MGAEDGMEIIFGGGSGGVREGGGERSSAVGLEEGDGATSGRTVDSVPPMVPHPAGTVSRRRINLLPPLDGRLSSRRIMTFWTRREAGGLSGSWPAPASPIRGGSSVLPA